MLRKIFSILALLIGIGILVYPHVSSYFSEKNSSIAAEEYQKKTKEMTKAEREKLWAEAEKYNENLTGSPVHDPFIPGSGIVMPENYYDVLNVDGKMATIEIPRIKVKLPVYHGTSDSVLQQAVGHLEGSSLPIGGKDRHAVLTGHTGLSHAKIFTNLVELKEEDKFYVNVLGKTLAYQVDQIKVITPDQTEELKVVEGQDHVTLLTCTPYGINSHRLLVRGVRIPYDKKEKAEIKAETGLTAEQITLLKIAALTTLIMLVLIIITWMRNRRKSVNMEDHGNGK